MPLTGLEYLAEADQLDVRGADPGALEGSGDRNAAEFGRIDRGKSATHLAESGAGGGENHCAGHLPPFMGGVENLGSPRYRP
jgi:hypothetical protein